MTIKILKEEKDSFLIGWSESGEFGQIEIYYSGNGNYTIDAEFIGFERLFKILELFIKERFNN